MEQRHEPSAGSALWLPLFDELSDPVAVARLAAEAEEVGWQGVFVWDHLRWQAPVRQVADGRFVLGAGIGDDRFGGELSATGEQLDDRREDRCSTSRCRS